MAQQSTPISRARATAQRMKATISGFAGAQGQLTDALAHGGRALLEAGDPRSALLDEARNFGVELGREMVTDEPPAPSEPPDVTAAREFGRNPDDILGTGLAPVFPMSPRASSPSAPPSSPRTSPSGR